MKDGPPPPTVWPPPIYRQRPSSAPAQSDPEKLAWHHATLGWSFLVLSLVTPVFLPFTFYYGWQARCGGQTSAGGGILGGAGVLTAVLLVVLCWVMNGG